MSSPRLLLDIIFISASQSTQKPFALNSCDLRTSAFLKLVSLLTNLETIFCRSLDHSSCKTNFFTIFFLCNTVFSLIVKRITKFIRNVHFIGSYPRLRHYENEFYDEFYRLKEKNAIEFCFFSE